jgi:hypothetical protein
MVTPELIEYVKTERARGVSNEVLRQVLQTAGGWSFTDIEEALRMNEVPSVPTGTVQSVIAATNAAHAKQDGKVKGPIDPALQQFRNKKKWAIFSILSSIVLVFMVIAYIEDPYGFWEGLWIPLAVLVVAYLASMFIVRTVKPTGSVAKDILVTILLAVLAIAFTFLIAGGLCLATCLVIGLSGGF